MLVDAVLPCADNPFDDSSPGVGTWQLLPPGLSCTYSNEDMTLVVPPERALYVVALLLLALPAYALARRHLALTQVVAEASPELDDRPL
jgi:hypothetical protein